MTDYGPLSFDQPVEVQAICTGPGGTVYTDTVVIDPGPCPGGTTFEITEQPQSVQATVGSQIDLGGAATGLVTWQSSSSSSGPWTPTVKPAVVTSTNDGMFFRFCDTDTGLICSNVVQVSSPSTSILCQPWAMDIPRSDPTPISLTNNRREIRSLSDWNSTWPTAQPGDVLVFTGPSGSTITGPFDLRGNDADGSGPNVEGVPGNHITITCDPGITLTAPASGFNTVLSVRATKHVDVINCTIDGGIFGLVYRCVRGTAGSRNRIANNTVRNTRDAHIAVQGWFTNVSQGGFTGAIGESTFVDIYDNVVHGSPTNSGQSEGIYFGTGSPSRAFQDRTHDVRAWRNEIYDIASDGFDIKPGLLNVEVTDNYIHDLVFGGSPCCPVAGISALYSVGAVPAGFPSDPNVLIARNRISNLSGFAGGLRAIDVGYGGVTVESNLGWGSNNTAFIRVQTEDLYGPPGGGLTPITIRCNSSTVPTVEVVNQGGVPLPGINQDDNIPGQHAATFIGPTTGTADAGEGPGSGLALSAGTGGQGSSGCTDATGCTANSPSDQGALAVP